MLTQQQMDQVTQTIGKIKDALDNYYPGDNLKVAVEIYDEIILSLRTCPHCRIDLAAEAEMFSQDRLFTGHSCRGDKK